MKAPPFTRLGAWAFALAALVVGLDQLSKWWILGPLDLDGRGRIALSPLLDLTMVWNRGVSFGLFGSDSEVGRWLLAGFSAAVAVALAAWAWRAARRWTAVALGLVIGGAVGNLVDRVRFGAVADFIDFGRLFPWVFNLADAAISVGVVLLLLDSLLEGRTERRIGERARVR